MAVPTRRCSQWAASPLAGVAPIAYRTMAEQMAGSIRTAIAQGRTPPATRLLEVSLAREMRTSRAPVREALGLLEREGLVIKEPNRGARVVELTAEIVREVASLRGLLEGFAASLAADTKQIPNPNFHMFETRRRQNEPDPSQSEASLHMGLADSDLDRSSLFGIWCLGVWDLVSPIPFRPIGSG